MPKRLRILGLMSGSSLDGVDLACCDFTLNGSDQPFQSWTLVTRSVHPYPANFIPALRSAGSADIVRLMQLDDQLGHLYADMVHDFIRDLSYKPDLLAIHGHTVRHEPQQGYSLQLGSGAWIAAHTGIPVVSQLRDADIAAGGQGAPLAPLADRFLYAGYDAYLNIGGIANIYLPAIQQAFDTGGANQLLNHLSNQLGQPYDAGGAIAAGGRILPELMSRLASLPYFKEPAPKSLSNQWVQEIVIPIIEAATGSLADKMHTCCHHIAWHISTALNGVHGKVLLSGGGARNTFLVDCLRQHCRAELIIPADDTIDYKEATLCALVGLFCQRRMPAPLAQLSGARQDTVPGALYLPPSK